MESSIAEFLVRWPACERLPTSSVAYTRNASTKVVHPSAAIDRCFRNSILLTECCAQRRFTSRWMCFGLPLQLHRLKPLSAEVAFG